MTEVLEDSGTDCREIAIEKFIDRINLKTPSGVEVYSMQEKCELLWAFKLGYDTANRDWNMVRAQES